MSPTVAARRQSEQGLLPDKVGCLPAKANLSSPTDRTFALGATLWEVLVKGHGSVKAAAFTMGQTDPSLLRRQVLDGTLPLKRLLEADAKALVTFGEFLVEHYGEASKSKAQLAREKLPELLATLLDLVEERK